MPHSSFRMTGRAVALTAALFYAHPAEATLVGTRLDLTGSTAAQSSTLAGYTADLAINGNLGDFTHTDTPESNATWTLELPANARVNLFRVWNRGDGCCPERLRDITVTVYEDTAQQFEQFNSGLLNPGNSLNGPRKFDIMSAAPVNTRLVKIARSAADPATHDGSVLSLGEVELFTASDQVLPPGTDLTRASILGMTVTQSTTLGGFTADLAVNGNNGDFTHTLGDDATPFWEVNFGENLRLETVNLHNRESCCGSRLRDITIEVLNNAGQTVFTSPLLNPENSESAFPSGPADLFFDFAGANGGSPLFGQTVRVRRTSDPDLSGSGGQGNPDEANVLSLGEVTVIGGSVPEPSSAVLLGFAALALAGRGRSRR